jgi:hypothetical protein
MGEPVNLQRGEKKNIGPANAYKIQTIPKKGF